MKKKADMADDFAEKYEGKVEDFVEFISQEDLIAPEPLNKPGDL